MKKLKQDGSGGGIRLNKGRGGCEIEDQEEYGRGKRESKKKLFKMEKIKW